MVVFWSMLHSRIYGPVLERVTVALMVVFWRRCHSRIDGGVLERVTVTLMAVFWSRCHSRIDGGVLVLDTLMVVFWSWFWMVLHQGLGLPLMLIMNCVFLMCSVLQQRDAIS